MSLISLKSRKLITVISSIFIGVIAYFLYGALSSIEWDQVSSALKAVPLKTVLGAFALVVTNYAWLGLYDTLAFHHLAKKTLSIGKIIPSAMVCYAFNFNLGSLVGGLGLRLKIYTGWGVNKKRIPYIAIFSVITNWSGFIFILSSLFLLTSLWVKGAFAPPTWLAYLAAFIGFGLLTAYLYGGAKNFYIKFGESRFHLPPIPLGSTQIAISTIQWLLASTIIFLFLKSLAPEGVPLTWGRVLYTFLIASIGGLIARIPAGIGVLEAVFLKMTPQLQPSIVLAGLLCFRAVYYLAPLLLAIPGLIAIELIQRASKSSPVSSKIQDRAIIGKNEKVWRSDAKHI